MSKKIGKEEAQKEFTNQEALNLFTSLKSIKGYRGVKFNYAICKNVERLESANKSLYKEAERINKIADFEEKNKQNEEFKTLLTQSSEFVPHLIKAEDIPSADLLTEHMMAIYPLIEGEL